MEHSTKRKQDVILELRNFYLSKNGKNIFPNISYQQKTTYYQNNFINNVADFELDYFPHITNFIGRYLIYIRKMHLTMTRLLRKGKLIPIVLKSRKYKI